MKSLLQSCARKWGYEIRKAPHPGFHSAPIYDLCIAYLLSTRGNERTFIEVGANDGMFGDPLRKHIISHPWRGVLIEPQPEVFQKLKSNYAGFEERVSFENVAISDDPAPLSMYRLPASHTDSDTVTAAVASFDPKTTAKQLGVRPDQLEKIVVPTARLDDIIAKYDLGALDILQLDTEGFDWHVLRTINLKKTRPLLIRFEHGHLSPKAIGEMTRHLNEHDYSVHFGGYESDSVAMRSDFIIS